MSITMDEAAVRVLIRSLDVPAAMPGEGAATRPAGEEHPIATKIGL